MRVLFAIHELALNGAVTVLLRHVRHMCARGDTVTLLVPPLQGHAAALEGAFRQAGAILASQITSLADFDVAVGCTIFADGVLARIADQIPCVWWIHEGQAGLITAMARPSVTETLPRVGKIIIPSRGVAEDVLAPLLNQLSPGRVEIIPAPIPPPPDGPAMPRVVPQILCVGSIYPRKRQADLIQAVASLSDLSVQCVFVGQAFSIPDSAQALIRHFPDRFVLTGGLPPEDVHAWYRSADIFCLPYGDESLGIAPIEAAWHGVPVVLTDLEAYRGVWRHGVNALLYPTGDVELLAWSLRMLLGSPQLRARCVAGGRAVAQRFSESRAFTLFDEALREAIATFPLHR